ncbi:MAG: hypothetical protein V3R23_04420, partial [Nitrospinaceae bacterium]
RSAFRSSFWASIDQVSQFLFELFGDKVGILGIGNDIGGRVIGILLNKVNSLVLENQSFPGTLLCRLLTSLKKAAKNTFPLPWTPYTNIIQRLL